MGGDSARGEATLKAGRVSVGLRVRSEMLPGANDLVPMTRARVAYELRGGGVSLRPEVELSFGRMTTTQSATLYLPEDTFSYVTRPVRRHRVVPVGLAIGHGRFLVGADLFTATPDRDSNPVILSVGGGVVVGKERAIPPVDIDL